MSTHAFLTPHFIDLIEPEQIPLLKLPRNERSKPSRGGHAPRLIALPAARLNRPLVEMYLRQGTQLIEEAAATEICPKLASEMVERLKNAAFLIERVHPALHCGENIDLAPTPSLAPLNSDES